MESKNSKKLSKQINEYGMQAKMARAIGVSNTQLAAYAKGEYRPKREAEDKLESLYGYDPKGWRS